MQHYIPLIRKLRKASNLTQQQVADYLHLDRSTYAYYESGRTKINIDILSRLARFFQISLGQLVGEEPPTITTAILSDGTDEAQALEAMLINESASRFQQISRDEQHLIILFRSATPEQRNNILAQAAAFVTPLENK